MSEPLSAESIREITKLAQAAVTKKPSVVEFNDPLDRFLLVDAEGKHTIMDRPPERLDCELDTIDDLVRFVEDRIENTRDDETFEFARAYVGRCGVVVVFDRDDHRSRARVSFSQTPAFAWLCGVEAGVTMSQRDLIRALRVTLDGTLPADGGLLNLVRNIKFQASSDGSANIQHGRESIGRSIVAETRGVEAIPDSFTVYTAPWNEHQARQSVRVYLEPMPGEQAFYVKAFPQSLADAEAAALEAIRAQVDPDIVSFVGNPE